MRSIDVLARRSTIPIIVSNLVGDKVHIIDKIQKRPRRLSSDDVLMGRLFCEVSRNLSDSCNNIVRSRSDIPFLQAESNLSNRCTRIDVLFNNLLSED